MAYTQPNGDAADFSWSGELAYTAPDVDAADFAFAPDSATASIVAVGVIGQTSVSVDVSRVAMLMSNGAIGLPSLAVEARISAADLLSPGLVGTPSVLGWHGSYARMIFSGVVGAPSLRAAQSVQTIHLWPGVIGRPGQFVAVYPPRAVALPDASARYYLCRLTGAADGLSDAELPISAFSVRHRVDTESYYQITIPTTSVVDAIADRPNGQIVIEMACGGITEELMRGSLGSIRTDKGARSQSISISGNASRAATEARVYDALGVSYAYTTFVGDARLRIAPRAAIRPGDTLRYQGAFFEIGEVSWSVSVSAGGMSEQMEVVRI